MLETYTYNHKFPNRGMQAMMMIHFTQWKMYFSLLGEQNMNSITKPKLQTKY